MPYKIVSILLLMVLCIAGFSCSYGQGLSVENFLSEVSSIQRESDAALVDLNEQINGLQGEPDQIRDSVERLKSSRASIETARQEIDALDAPEAATVLKQDLLDLYLQGGGLMDELVLSGNYQLEIQPVSSEYEKSAKAFSDCMTGTDNEAGILSCLRIYQKAVIESTDSAREMHPPTISRKSHERFVSNLGTLQLGISEMIAGIEGKDTPRIEAASNQLSSISGDNEALKQAMQADRAADITAYNAKVTKMSDLSRKINEDQAELHRQFDTK